MIEDFNPNSANAMFGKIMERLEQQDRTAARERTEIKEMISVVSEAANKMSRRILSLERWRDTSKAKVAVIITLATVLATGAWAVIQYLFLK